MIPKSHGISRIPHRASRVAIACAIAAAIGGLIGAFPTSNSAGGVLTQAGAETWLCTTQTNSAGARVELVATLDGSSESSNPAGAILFSGLIDPIPPAGGPTDAAHWQAYQ